MFNVRRTTATSIAIEIPTRIKSCARRLARWAGFAGQVGRNRKDLFANEGILGARHQDRHGFRDCRFRRVARCRAGLWVRKVTEASRPKLPTIKLAAVSPVYRCDEAASAYASG